uniref:Zinc finger and BTB domain containing 48 n=1 Tax=Acanthochromis polyacanthus TaxID=80966 RepID=A0A3Q1F251_9TELE
MPAVDSHHAQRVLSSLNQQRAVGRFCDATLSVGGGVSYLAHRNVLACFSELFQRSNMPTSPSMELCLQGCPDEGLELLLNFVYTGELKLGPDNLEKVQQAATSLCIPEALRLCQQYKETSVDPVPVKRKRGRPRKSASDANSIKEEISVTVNKDDSENCLKLGSLASCHKFFCSPFTYTCSTCSSTFNTKEDLRLHVVSHTGDMPHKCTTCPEQFMYKKNLTLHMMKVHVHSCFTCVCTQCPKTFLTRTELRVHEAAKHRGEKNERPFVCTLCGHAFSQKNNLNMHLRIHSGERPYQCHLCGKTFRTQASLDKHHRTHTGERPFSCDVCEQRFTEKGALIRHKASKHEEGRPHCCDICGKTFKAREQLRVHLRRHKGMRKFECIDCGYKFTRQAHLRRHVLIHKRTENYNPRQRKLRNVVVQDVDGSSAENEAGKSAEASLITDGTGYVPETAIVQESTNPESDPSTGLASGCIVRVVIESSEAVIEEAVSNQNLRHPVDTVDSFSVPEVLQRTQLVTEAYQTIDMEGIVENLSVSKT